MATLKILGACSGTEPMENLHHTSIVLTINGCNYFFDAGENCSHTAHVQGVDLLKTRAVFISHTHYDHIGGLMGLFWNVNKVAKHNKTPVRDGKIQLYIPNVSVWNNILSVLNCTEGGFRKDFEILVEEPNLSTFYKDENISVTAFESHHIPKSEDGKILSFGYVIETKGKKIVFSGDLKDLSDLAPALVNGCDILMCETGHHTVEDVCKYAQENGVKKLVFIHHGREVLENRPSVRQAIDNCDISVEIALDKMNIDVEECK